MAIDDCYFFLTTGCNKGDACKFRHSVAAKESQESCQSYVNTGTCTDIDCGKRHSSFHLHNSSSSNSNNNNRDQICYFERVKGACTKDSCQFKHFHKQGTVAVEPKSAGKEAAWREAVVACTSKLAQIEQTLLARFAKLNDMFIEVDIKE